MPSSQLRKSPDSILTSLAQLGAWRTGTSRALISIFDRKWQYIVAEATPTLSLISDPTEAKRDGQELWLCQTAIPRAHGVCEWPLTWDDASPSSDLPVTIVPDLQTDARFRAKPYCLPGSPARFYAAAPIRSSRGINIGVYCVLHDKPMPEQKAKDAALEAVMRDIARTIMQHLESRHATVSLKRSDSMMDGITSFLDKQDTLHDCSRRGHSTPHHNVRGGLDDLDGNEKDGAVDMSLLSPLPSRNNKSPNPPAVRPSASSLSLRALGDDARGETTPADNGSDDDSAAAPIARPTLHIRSSTAGPDSSSLSWSRDHTATSIDDICMQTAAIVRASLDADSLVSLFLGRTVMPVAVW